jgi:hypothetical protein
MLELQWKSNGKMNGVCIQGVHNLHFHLMTAAEATSSSRGTRKAAMEGSAVKEQAAKKKKGQEGLQLGIDGLKGEGVGVIVDRLKVGNELTVGLA